MSQQANERNANVTLTADVSGYTQGVRAAGAETQNLQDKINALGTSLDRIAKSAGTKLQIFGVGTLAGVGGAVTAYALLEKKLADLHATAAVTGKNFDALRGQVNNLRREFPTTTEEAAALVRQVAQLGDGTASVQKLTTTFMKLGAATGESTTGLAQGLLMLQRQMGTSQQETRRYANVLTDLSQSNGVAASSIMDFSSQIAPIAKVAGMSQQAVMGISTAFIKAGQDGYMAGNAFNKMLSDIMQATVTGSPDLAKYAGLIGLTVDQFQKMDKTKAITQIFDELNRMGPSAIAILNRMGLDGMRTIKAITGMTQQTGGIGQAVAEATRAYDMGNASGNQLDRGSAAATGGLIDNLHKLKNTFAQLGEAIGKSVEPFVNVFVKGLNNIGQAAAHVMNGPLGKLLSLIGTGLGGAALGGGTLLHMGGLLMTAATGVLAFRNFATGGFMAGRAFAGGQKVEEMTGLAGKVARATTRGSYDALGRFHPDPNGEVRAGPVGRTMASVGGRLGVMSTNIVPFGATGAGRIPLFNRIAGFPMHAGAAAIRLMMYGLEPALHPFDPSARSMMFGPNVRSFRDAGRALMGIATGPMGNLQNQLPPMAQSYVDHQGKLARILSSNERLANMWPFKRYMPDPKNVDIFGPNGPKTMLTGIGAGASNLGNSARTAMLELAKANAALLGLAGSGAWNVTKAGFAAGLSGEGGLARGFFGRGGALLGGIAGFPMAHPILTAAALGYGAYSLIHSSKQSLASYSYEPNAPSMIDAYAKAVGEATVATHEFANALKDAKTDIKPPKTAAQAITATQKDFNYATSDRYSYTSKMVGKVSDADLQNVVNMLMGGTDGAGADPKMAQRIKLDVLRRTNSITATNQILKNARSHMGQFDYATYLRDLAGQSGTIGGFVHQNKDMKTFAEQLPSLMDAQRNIAANSGGQPAARLARRGQFASLIGAMQQVENLSSGRGNTQDVVKLTDIINKVWFGRDDKLGIKGADMGSMSKHAFGLGNTININRALAQKTPQAAVLDLYRQFTAVTPKQDEKTYNAFSHMLAINGLSRTVAELGAGRDVTGAVPPQTVLDRHGLQLENVGGKTLMYSPVDRSKLTQMMPATWAQIRSMSGSYLNAQDRNDLMISNAAYHPLYSPGVSARDAKKGLEVGSAFLSNPVISKAILSQNSGNENMQYSAIDQMIAEMSKMKLSVPDMVGALQQLKGVIGDTTNPLYNLATAAQQAAQRLGSITTAFKGPGGQYQDQVATYQAIMQTKKGPEFRKDRQQAKSDITQQTIDAIMNVKQMAIQQREFNIQRTQAQNDYNVQVRRSDHEYNLMRDRAEADFARGRERAQQQYNISRHDAEADFQRQRLYSEQDYQHQVKLMVQQSAKDMIDIYNRVNVQRTWSGETLLQNMTDQLARLKKQKEELNQARGMGLSNAAIKMLDLANPANQQQLDTLIHGFQVDPKLVAEYNKMAKDRLKVAGNLVKDSGNATWVEMQHQHQIAMRRSEKEFKISMERSARNFHIQMEQQRVDFGIQMDRAAADHTRQMNQMATDFDKQMTRAKNLNTRTANDMAMSINDIFTLAGDTLSGALLRQAKLVQKGWKAIHGDITGEAIKVVSDLTRIFGISWKTGGPGTSSSGTTPGERHHLRVGGGDAAGATGGVVLPGWSPGKDDHLFIHSKTGQRLHLAGGESIMVPQFTAAVGGTAGVARLNEKAKRGQISDEHFASGGTFKNRALSAQNFARSQVGHPYVWGGVGPGGYDCSGFMSVLTRYLLGQSDIYRRYGSTGSFPWPGFKPGPGMFTIGSTNNYKGTGIGHMAGTLLGLNVESRGGAGVVVGSHARGYKDSGFTVVFHLGKGGDFGYSGKGGGKWVDPRMEVWPFEKNVAKTPTLNKFLSYDHVMSKVLNKAITAFAKKHHIDLVNGPPSFADGIAKALKNMPSAPENVPASVRSSVDLGQAMAARRGWTGKQWDALYNLWMGESGWKWWADNPSSSAYGIPQSLPGSKMASAGADWKTNPRTQISWGLGYIKDRYGSPAHAYSQWLSRSPHWYGEGAIFNGPRKIGVGERGPEAVLPLNAKGVDFITALIERNSSGAKKMNTHGCSVPMTNNTYHYRIDQSTTFSGAISVSANDPRAFAEELRIKQRRDALTQPVLARRN